MKQKAFTLIELLVVIAIIGILAGLIILGFNSVRKKARDAQRKSDLAQILTMLEMFYDDYGYLPRTWTYGEAGPGGWDYSWQDGDGDGRRFLDFLEEKGIVAKIPVDPLNNGAGDTLFRSIGGTGYAYAYYCYDQAGDDDAITLGTILETNDQIYWPTSQRKGYTCGDYVP